MQSVSSRIWTRFAVSISCDDNYYTTGTSTLINPYDAFLSLVSRGVLRRNVPDRTKVFPDDKIVSPIIFEELCNF